MRVNERQQGKIIITFIVIIWIGIIVRVLVYPFIKNLQLEFENERIRKETKQQSEQSRSFR